MAKVLTFQFDADLRNSVLAFVETARKVKDVEGGLKSLTTAARQAGQEIETTQQALRRKSAAADAATRSTGALIGQIAAVAGPTALAYGAYNALTTALREYREESERAAQFLRTMQPAIAGAVLESGGDARTLARMRASADAIAAREGLSRDDALKLVSTAQREGFTADAGLFAGAQRRLGLNADQLMHVMGKFREGFPSEGLTGRAMLDQALYIARQAKAEPEALIEMLEQAGTTGEQLGGTSAEMMGALAYMTTRTKPKKALAAVRKLAVALSGGVDIEVDEEPDEADLAEARRLGIPAPKRKRVKKALALAGAGLFEKLHALEEAAPDELQKMMDSSPDVRALVEGLRSGAISNIAAGIGPKAAGTAERLLRVAGTDETVAAQIRTDRAKIGQQIADEQRARYAELVAQRRAELETAEEKAGTSKLERWARRRVVGFVPYESEAAALELMTREVEGGETLGRELGKGLGAISRLGIPENLGVIHIEPDSALDRMGWDYTERRRQRQAAEAAGRAEHERLLAWYMRDISDTLRGRLNPKPPELRPIRADDREGHRTFNPYALGGLGIVGF